MYIGLIVLIVFFVVIWICVIYEIKNAPIIEDVSEEKFDLCQKCNKRIKRIGEMCFCEMK